MNTQLEELAALREAIRDVLTARADRAAIRKFMDGGAAMDAALWAQAAELGWFGLNISENEGGVGLGVSAVLVLFEELGYAVAPLPALGTLLASEALTHAGSPAQRAAFLPHMAAGERPAAFALPGGGAMLQLSDGKILSGSIDLVIDAAAAKLAVLPAATTDGTSVFVVLDLTADGVVVAPQNMADLTRRAAAISVTDLRLDDLAILTGPSNDLAAHMTSFAGLLLAADSLGAAKGIFDQTVAYLKTREQFGKPIGSFQALKHRAAEHHIAMVGAGALLANAAMLWETQNEDAALHAGLCKAYICDLAVIVATDAVQLHGGIGFTWEHECHLYLKRILLNAHLFGSAAAHFELAFARLATSFAKAA